MPDDATTTAADFLARREREQRRHYARRPRQIGSILAQLITARGYGRVQANEDFAAAWRETVGDTLAGYTRPGKLRRGVLEITAGNSAVVQEFTFQKQQIIATLKNRMPDARIRDLRFRIGSIA